MLTSQAPHRSAEEFQLRYAGASADLSRVFFAANDALSGASATAPPATDFGAGKFNLYEWHAGQLSLVNVKPGNATTAPGAFGAGSALPISADGSRAIWCRRDERAGLRARSGRR